MRTLLSAPPTERVGRYPNHSFQTREIPFTAQPFFIARVLPGETLTNMFFEARAVTDPILNPIIGWKKEYYFFYVRATDLLMDAFKNMFVDPTNAEIAGNDEAANVPGTYTAKGAIDWTRLCRDRIVETYFRDEGETAASRSFADGSRVVQIRDTKFLDSLTDKDMMPEGDAIASATDMGDLDRLMDAYEMLRAMNLADMTYEDWLKSNGIAIPGKDENRPELLARFHEYTYPSNTIDPATGAPSSAVSWVFKNGERKPKFFKEPGFLMGISVTRPKVYYAGLAGSALGFAQRAWDWVPNYMSAMPETALKNFPVDTGPVGDRDAPMVWDAYWLDMRDDLIHGDQWQNMQAFSPTLAAATNGANHMAPLPDATGNFKYVPEAFVKSIFKTPASAFYVRQDGFVSLSIKGLQVDYTQGNLALA